MFFSLSTGLLALIIFGIVIGASVAGELIGRGMRDRKDHLRDSVAVMQTALLAFMALVLAFGLSLAVGRYEARRAATVEEANAIGTTYLRAQTLAEPMRTKSLGLLKRFTDISIRISDERPGSAAQKQALDTSSQIERQLWHLADESLVAAPEASAPRLYVETLNEMFDAQTSRAAGLGNRVPTTVEIVEVIGSAVAIFVVSLHIGLLGHGLFTGVVAAALVALILLVTFDLDRPTRGFIRVPSSTLERVRTSMEKGPAADGPGG